MKKKNLLVVLFLASVVHSAQKPDAPPRAAVPVAAPAPSPATAPQGAEENLGSMEVTGQAKDKVLIEKPTPVIKIDPAAIVDSVTEKTEKLLDRPIPVPSDDDFLRFNRMGSDLTRRPWLPDLAEPPLIQFRPEPSKTVVKGWRLEVTDDQGNVVQTLSGKENAVKEIIWDGRDQLGQMIKVGSAYSFRFITLDDYGNAHTTLGKAFTLKHLKFEDKKNVIIELANTYLYKDENIAPEAVPHLDRAVDVLREYSRFPFTIEFHSDAPQGDLLKARQKKLTEKIAADLLLPPESLKYVYQEIKDRADVTRFVIRLRN